MAEQTFDLVQYYAKLLIIQYLSKPRAYDTIVTQTAAVVMPQVSVQLITFLSPPASGNYGLRYPGVATTTISWNDDAAAIQTKLRGIAGLAAITVTGDTTVGFTVTFVSVTPPAKVLEVTSSTLNTGIPMVAETDLTIPLAVQDAFNLNAPVAIGAQLDVLGQYVGVTRIAQGLSGVIVLNDADFVSLIRVAVLTNSAQSDLATIQDLIHTFFPTQMRVYDYQNMRMSYLISQGLGSLDLIEMFVVQGLLPRPMAVQVATIIYAPTIDKFFGFSSYEDPTPAGITPFNSYVGYHMDWPWLDYVNGIPI